MQWVTALLVVTPVGLSDAEARPKADIEEFRDNRDGTATLVIVCSNGARLDITVDRKRLDMMNVDAIYAFIKLHCKNEEKKL